MTPSGRPGITDGRGREERDRLWTAGPAIYPGWAAYARRAAHRTIPVFVLEPTE